MYKIMSYLVRNNITPHLFQYSDSLMNIDINQMKQSSQILEFINEFIIKKHKAERNNEIPPNFTHVCALLTETADNDVSLIKG